mgnify:CR=1 FL=1
MIFLDANDIDDPYGIDVNLNGVADAGDTPLEPLRPLNLDRPRVDTNLDGVFNAADAHITTDSNLSRRSVATSSDGSCRYLFSCAPPYHRKAGFLTGSTRIGSR